MTAKDTLERWSGPLVVAVLLVLVILMRANHAHFRPSNLDSSSQPGGQSASALAPSAPPSPATVAELESRGKGLHWLLVDARTVTIVTARGGCGTLTAVGPDHISFHTGRNYDRETHLFSTWSDAYTAGELYCEDWARRPAPAADR